LHLKLLTTATILVFCFTSTALAFAQNDDKIVVFHTEFGHLAIELFPDDAPNTVENFLKLAESDFYDKTIFHRIISGFMIQGGDPNSKESDQSKWGLGGTGDNLKAEFNNIKHDRGIASMARSAHPDSASSQFFIVHEKSTHLDEKYTVFGRIITQESYDTLDKIANLETITNNIPLEAEKAEIKKTEVVTRSSLENILTLDTPERVESAIIEEVIAPEYIDGLTGTGGDGKYRNTEYGFSFVTQEGWMLQRTTTGSDQPVLVALGVGKDSVTPAFTFEALETTDVPFEEFFAPRLESYRELDDGVKFDILSEEYYTGANRIAGKHGIVLVATQTMEGPMPDGTKNVVIKFKQVILEAVHFHFIITYVNQESNFDEFGLVEFDNIVSSFRTFMPESQKFTNPENEVIVLDDESFNETEKSGCLIATATFGTEMAPQVQFLREIRDNIVLQTESGTSFMTAFNQFYYSFSPTIADYERENPVFKEAVKLAITPLLASLTLLQFADIDSESEMLGYGISVILLNVGMYFVIPAVFIMKIRKLQ